MKKKLFNRHDMAEDIFDGVGAKKKHEKKQKTKAVNIFYTLALHIFSLFF